MTKEEILRRELKELQAHRIENQATRSKKKRKVLGSEPLTNKEAKARMVEKEKGGDASKRSQLHRTPEPTDNLAHQSSQLHHLAKNQTVEVVTVAL